MTIETGTYPPPTTPPDGTSGWFVPADNPTRAPRYFERRALGDGFAWFDRSGRILRDTDPVLSADGSVVTLADFLGTGGTGGTGNTSDLTDRLDDFERRAALRWTAGFTGPRCWQLDENARPVDYHAHPDATATALGETVPGSNSGVWVVTEPDADAVAAYEASRDA